MDDANHNELTRLPASPKAILQTHAGRLPDEKQLHDGTPRNVRRRTVEFYSGDGDSHNDTAQPRSSVRNLMINHPHAPLNSVTKNSVPSPPPPPPPTSVVEMNVPPPPPPISIAEINVPPTPPPPPPPMSSAEMQMFPLPPISPLGGPYSSRIPMAQSSAELEKLDYEQESLRDLRDELMGARFRMAAKRKELRDLHISTVAKDGHVFNLLRQYLNDACVDVPQNIADALADACSLRDQLGVMEVGYDETEASYNKLEWTYSRRETRFVERVLDNNLVPSDTLDRSRSADNLEILQLTRSMTRSTKDDPVISDFAAYTDEIGTRSIAELSAFLAEQNLATPQGPRERFQGSSSPWKSPNDLISVRTKPAEGFNPTHDHLRWMEKMNKIHEWLFDTVDTSPLQKLCLKAMHDFGFTDTTTWWEHTKWLLVQDYSTHFHTGDSTAFSHTVSARNLEPTEGGMSSVSSALESCSTNQVLLGIQSAAVPDDVALSATIESSEYREAIDQAAIPRNISADIRRGATGVEMAQISQNKASAILDQKIGFQTSRDLTCLPKRNHMPQVKETEPQEVSVLPVKLDVNSISSGSPPQPTLDPNSRNQRRKVSSHTRITPHQFSESGQSSSLATSNSKSPRSKESVSSIDRYLVT